MMLPPHDFEFQLGKNRALRGRGWCGLLALGIFLLACVTIMIGSPAIISPIRSFIAYLSDIH